MKEEEDAKNSKRSAHESTQSQARERYRRAEHGTHPKRASHHQSLCRRCSQACHGWSAPLHRQLQEGGENAELPSSSLANVPEARRVDPVESLRAEAVESRNTEPVESRSESSWESLRVAEPRSNEGSCTEEEDEESFSCSDDWSSCSDGASTPSEAESCR